MRFTKTSAKVAGSNVRKPARTAEHAGELLDELRRAYQALTPEERQQVKAFITELSYRAGSGEVERDPLTQTLRARRPP
jgi:hypothetical protein